MDTAEKDALALLLICFIMLTIIIFADGKPKKKKRRFRLNIHFHNSNYHHMSLNSVTLTDKNVKTGLISVVDTVTGNALTGTLANIQAVDSDTTVDTVAVDPKAANTIDVQAVANAGGSVINVTADFTSVGNAGITDGTVFTGIKGQATVVNQIPTTPQPALAINF